MLNTARGFICQSRLEIFFPLNFNFDIKDVFEFKFDEFNKVENLSFWGSYVWREKSVRQKEK